VTAALGYAKQLAVVTPDDLNLVRLVEELRQAANPRAR
jgi:hypothetical protein